MLEEFKTVYFRYFLALFEAIINNRDTILINTFVSIIHRLAFKPNLLI